MGYSFQTKELVAQPVIAIRRQLTRREEISAALQAIYPRVFGFARQSGLNVAGAPFCRYLGWEPGSIILLAGVPVASAARGSDDIVVDALPAGLAAVTLHIGPYDQLPAAYDACREWAPRAGWAIAGAPWESYVTDPGQSPDPNDWKTEVYWPVRTVATA